MAAGDKMMQKFEALKTLASNKSAKLRELVGEQASDTMIRSGMGAAAGLATTGISFWLDGRYGSEAMPHGVAYGTIVAAGIGTIVAAGMKSPNAAAILLGAATGPVQGLTGMSSYAAGMKAKAEAAAKEAAAKQAAGPQPPK